MAHLWRIICYKSTIPPTLIEEITQHPAFSFLIHTISQKPDEICIYSDNLQVILFECLESLNEIKDFAALSQNGKLEILQEAVSVKLNQNLVYDCWVCGAEWDACRGAGGSWGGCMINWLDCWWGCGGGGSSGGGGAGGNW